MANEAQAQATPEARYRGLLFIWLGQFVSLVAFLAMTWFSQVPVRGANSTLQWVFGVLSGAAVTLSFPLKFKLRQRAIAEQRPDYVTTAYVFAFALCELSAIFGLVEYFIRGVPNYLLFILAAVGFLLHFPRRQHLLAASAGHTSPDIKSTMH